MFFQNQQKKDIEATPSQTQCPASHWRVNTYSALSFDPIYLKMSVNPEDWHADFAFPDFNSALFERERS